MKQKLQKLPKRFKKKWVKALRSGEYAQGAGYLFNDREGSAKYCCLGVACHISGYENDKIRHLCLIPNNFLDIPEKIRRTSTIVGKLANFNDKGRSFKWIASYIERYL